MRSVAARSDCAPIWKQARAWTRPSATICPARHRDDASGGCPTAALVAEISRHPKTTRDAFTGKIVELVDLIAARAGKGSARKRRKRAIAVYGLMVGALQLARAVNDRKLSDEILESAADSALALAGGN